MVAAACYLQLGFSNGENLGFEASIPAEFTDFDPLEYSDPLKAAVVITEKMKEVVEILPENNNVVQMSKRILESAGIIGNLLSHTLDYFYPPEVSSQVSNRFRKLLLPGQDYRKL